MKARYGNINTVAGSGFSDNCNDWNAIYEGGDAVAAELSVPHMAVADAAGRIYIADKESFAVRMVDVDGKIHRVAGSGVRGVSSGAGVATSMALREPNGVYLLPNGTFYLIEVDDNCQGSPIPGGTIRKVTPDGMMETVVSDPTLLAGRALWVSPDESEIVYASGTTMRKWTASGGIETFSSGYTELGNIDRAPDGNFIITDRKANRVWRVQADGTGKTAIAGNGAETGGGSGQLATGVALFEVRGVAILENGGYFVCTHKGGQVWYVDSSGYIWLFIHGDNSKSTHSGDGLPPSATLKSISEPRAITLAPNGDLLITENDKGFIRRITNIAVKPEIVRQELTPGGYEIEWTSHREGNYVVQRSTDLSNWTNFLKSGGEGSTSVYRDESPPPEAFSFYRVREAE